ncbi:MAG: hypothetical protein ACXVZO_01370 [Gaiellaceae bacterium]
MVGGAAALLRLRLALAAALGVVLGLYYAFSQHLPQLSDLGDVIWVGFFLSGLVFGLVLLALPLWRSRPVELVLLALALAAVSAGFLVAGLPLAASFGKLAAATLAGFWFVRFFERLSWIVIIALLVPVADTISVWRGPTHQIVTQSPRTYDAASVVFPVPGARLVELRWQKPAGATPSGYDVYGKRGSTLVRLTDRPFCTSANDGCGKTIFFRILTTPKHRRVFVVRPVSAQGAHGPPSTISVPPSIDGDGNANAPAGPPGAVVDLRAKSRPSVSQMGVTDVFFFALFLAAAARFRLRPALAWLGMVIGLGVTMAIAVYSDIFGIGGLPALPMLSLGFLLPSLDLIWKQVRSDRVAGAG